MSTGRGGGCFHWAEQQLSTRRPLLYVCAFSGPLSCTVSSSLPLCLHHRYHHRTLAALSASPLQQRGLPCLAYAGSSYLISTVLASAALGI